MTEVELLNPLGGRIRLRAIRKGIERILDQDGTREATKMLLNAIGRSPEMQERIADIMLESLDGFSSDRGECYGIEVWSENLTESVANAIASNLPAIAKIFSEAMGAEVSPSDISVYEVYIEGTAPNFYIIYLVEERVGALLGSLLGGVYRYTPAIVIVIDKDEGIVDVCTIDDALHTFTIL